MVNAIKDMKKINALLMYLKGTSDRDYLLAKFQLNSGLRISDVVGVKVSDVMTNKRRFKEHLVINETKTNKIKTIKLNDELRNTIKEYVFKYDLKDCDYLFKSKKFDVDGNSRHITVTQAYRILKTAAESVGIDNFGTHSLRKTWGYFTYKASKHNIGLLMDMFNHSAPSITLRYIGIDQDARDEMYSYVQF
ncbi:tyrosine-type recombinase/integrase [Clostridium sp.]|uniref:tyrosine-type recombinase/integrase n=1 Tax=Clostridium sp. TaxID=1506 RepID=UPI00342265EF